jgi:ERCC4-type nuclease
MELICDYRENGIIKKLNTLKTKFRSKYSNITIKSENMVTGDFRFGNVLIERKSHADLVSSIVDGRYKEQCARLHDLRTKSVKEGCELRIFYIIEGSFKSSSSKFKYQNSKQKVVAHNHLAQFMNNTDINAQCNDPDNVNSKSNYKNTKIDKGDKEKQQIQSAIMTLMYEKQFQVLLTQDMNETSEFLLTFCHKYFNKYHTQDKTTCQDTGDQTISNDCSNLIVNDNVDDDEHHNNNNNNNNDNIENLIRQQNKKNTQINKDNIGVMMLCNVPYISMTVATVLLEPFDNDLHAFISHIKQNDTYLSSLKIPSGKCGKTRRLNKNISNILMSYFVEKSSPIVDLGAIEGSDHQHHVG